MSLEDNLRVIKLLDTYGAMLTDKQFSILSNYYYDNFTLTEIGDNLQISRQAVKDSIDKSIKILLNFENKLHFVSKCDFAISQLQSIDNNHFDESKITKVIEKLRE